ncbi:thiopurine S-methyltransferase [Algiphilus sp.]|uniref:thiopurine S-methyltransferase n=1 Tax=Algiphilus sp. TaxID=1872431 RepID=UPI0025C05704|nr:thiopurine S-methyltransferase [Algiphilus sp.]MCK5771128.1 thiopurine S-methyltransferase [Algiphilus sp.]
MDPDFWLARWDNEEIGFHQPDGNPLLAAHWPTLAIPPDAQVLVPLCGKTPDMAWLAARGHSVIGVELSEKAARALFAEQDVQPETHERDGFTVYSAGGIAIWVGDFFAMPAAVLADCSALYDRASLIALPPPMRQRFAALLTEALPADGRGLLVALDYDQSEMAGPPFSVPDSEIRQLFEPAFAVECLARKDTLADNERFRQKGLSRLWESAYGLTRNR